MPPHRQVNVQGWNYMRAKAKYTPLLIAEVEGIKESKGKLTPKDIGRMAVKFRLPMKTTFDFLGYAGIIPNHIWEIRGYNAQQILDAIEE